MQIFSFGYGVKNRGSKQPLYMPSRHVLYHADLWNHKIGVGESCDFKIIWNENIEYRNHSPTIVVIIHVYPDKIAITLNTNLTVAVAGHIVPMNFTKSTRDFWLHIHINSLEYYLYLCLKAMGTDIAIIKQMLAIHMSEMNYSDAWRASSYGWKA